MIRHKMSAAPIRPEDVAGIARAVGLNVVTMIDSDDATLVVHDAEGGTLLSATAVVVIALDMGGVCIHLRGSEGGTGSVTISAALVGAIKEALL